MTKTREVCIMARSPPASLPFKGQVTEQATVKSSVGCAKGVGLKRDYRNGTHGKTL